MCTFWLSADSTAHMSHDGHSYAWLLPRAVKCVLLGGQVQPGRSWRKVAAPIVMSGGLAQEPPWPNGQGVELLIRRLRVQVPQGVLLHQYRVAVHGSAPWRTSLVTRQRVLGCFRAARLGADGSDDDHRGRHFCARRVPSPPCTFPVPFRVFWQPAAAADKTGSLRANFGDAHRPGF